MGLSLHGKINELLVWTSSVVLYLNNYELDFSENRDHFWEKSDVIIENKFDNVTMHVIYCGYFKEKST